MADLFSIATGVVGLVSSLDSIISMCDRLKHLFENASTDYEREEALLDNLAGLASDLLRRHNDIPSQIKPGVLKACNIAGKDLSEAASYLSERKIVQKIRYADRVRELLNSAKEQMVLAQARVQLNKLLPMADCKAETLLYKASTRKGMSMAEGIKVSGGLFKTNFPDQVEDLRIVNGIETFPELPSGTYLIDKVSFGSTKVEQLTRRARLVGVAMALIETYDSERVAKICRIGQGKEAFYTVSAVKFQRPNFLSDKLGSIRDKEKVMQNVSLAVLDLHHAYILHKNIKASTILLDDNEDTQLAGLFVARMDTARSDNPHQTVDQMAERRKRMEMIYEAPERPHGRFSKDCDIYSFGVVMLEILLGTHLYDDPRIDSKAKVVQLAASHEETILAGMMPYPVLSMDFARTVIALVRECLRDTASERPGIDEVVGMLWDT